MVEFNGLVSVLIPCYNHEKYVIDCLESVKLQSNIKIELIICDDCSLDDSFEIIQKWVDNNSIYFSACYCYKNDYNLGITKTLNSLIRRSNGVYIKILASDDVLFDNCLYELVMYLENNSDNIVFSNMIIIDDIYSGQIIEKNKKYFFKKIPPYGKNIFDKLFNENTVAAPSVLFRYSTFERYGLFDEQLLFEDWEYWLRIEKNGGSIGYINKPLVGYRIHKKSASHFHQSEEDKKRQIKAYENNKYMLSKYKDYSKKGMDKFYNINLQSAMRSNNNELIESILCEKFSLCFSSRVKMLFYTFKYKYLIK